SCPPSGRSRAGRSPLRDSADTWGSACCRSRPLGRRAACCSADRGRSVHGPCDLLSVSAGARTLVPRPRGLRRRRLAAARDGCTAVVGLGSRRWTLEAGGARPPFLALAPVQHAIERRCRPTGSPCRDLDLRADLDGPQCGVTVLGGERDPIAPVGWTPDDRSASHSDDSILWKASRLDALEWWGEGTPRNSHVGLLGSGLSQAPTAQRPIPCG